MLSKRLQRKKDIKAEETEYYAGRPISYEPRFCQMLIDYFDQEPTEDVKIDHFKDGTKAWTDTKQKARKIPTLTKFCKIIDRSWQAVHEWLNSESAVFQQPFKDAYAYARAIRCDFLNDGALIAGYPPNTFKFISVNLTDQRDKQQVEHTGQFKDIAALMQMASKARAKQVDSREVLSLPVFDTEKEKDHVQG